MTMLGHRELAVGLGVVTAAALAYKQPLHGLVAKLGWDDVYAGVRLLVATFIILPLLPDRTLDPWAALNPYKLWLLVILISSLSLVGYVATRWLGAGRGTALTGITGGGLLDRGDALVRAPQPGRAGRRSRACLWHPARLGGYVRSRPGHGARGQRQPHLPAAPAVRRHGLRDACRRLAALPTRRRTAGVQDVPLKNPFSRPLPPSSR